MNGGATPPALGPVTPAMVDHLRATKPWVRLCSILEFIGTGLLLLFAAVLPFVGALSRDMGPLGGGLLSVMYLLLGCIYFFPSLFLFRYAGAIGSLVATGVMSAFKPGT